MNLLIKNNTLKNRLLNREPGRWQQYTAVLAIVIAITLVSFVFAYLIKAHVDNKWPENFFSFWRFWDTPHYLNIARHGYQPDNSEQSPLIVFFPLYPLFIKIFHFIFRNWLFSALFVSNLCYAISAFFLYKLVRLDYSHNTALRAVLYYSIFPTAYFLHAAYTESLFLCTIITSFYYARRGKWWLAALIGMLATATRITGITLLPALVLEYLDQRRFKLKPDILWLGLVLLGTGAYLLINKLQYGSFTAFLSAQSKIWTKSVALPWDGLISHARGFTGSPKSIIEVNLTEFTYGIFALVTILVASFKLRSSYMVYAFFSWVMITATSFLLSLPRYTLSLFPIFIFLGLAGKKRIFHYVYLFFAIILYSHYLNRYILGQWAF